MKKIVFYFFAASFLLLAGAPQLWANEDAKSSKTGTVVSEMAEVNEMVDRLNEIKEMNFKEMTSIEKKELRKEVRSIRRDLKAIAKSDSASEAQSAAEAAAAERGGFYISTGAAIIIVLLLILLL
ncbi:hypothetical protein GM418_27995 [Maribellus comscasis]|uniref:Uncharacterized protein n=1 Tax=Maribellus comscasis TaxID=2681766 RepID=A0A6I6K1T7_9BACT|nr:hypothetical protein [Maribellus comscasis]QGY47370.1 hypothetical protein GM418_27995 [Maribellus comscasis]